MQTAGKALAAVGAKVDPVATQQEMKKFAAATDRQQLMQMLMDDSIDNALDTDEMEGEADELVQQVLEEAGLEFAAQLKSTPTAAPVAAAPASAVQEDDGSDELMRRLASLRAA